MHSRTSREQWKYCNRHLRVLIVALAVASTPPLFRTHRYSLRKPSHVVKLADSDFAPTKVASTFTDTDDIKDEYGVQDLLRGVLRALFDDVRNEEYPQ